MAFTPEQQTEIIEAIRQRAPDMRFGVCPVCHTPEAYTVSPGFVFMVLQETTQAMQWTGSGLPCVALVCRTCGHTRFFNMLTLGLDHLVNPAPAEAPLRRVLRGVE